MRAHLKSPLMAKGKKRDADLFVYALFRRSEKGNLLAPVKRRRTNGRVFVKQKRRRGEGARSATDFARMAKLRRRE